MIPEHPILHPRCHTVRSRRTLAFRRGRRLLYLDDPQRLAFTERLIRVLDGRSLGELIQSLAHTAEDRLQALFLLHELGREGFLAARDGAVREAAAVAPPRAGRSAGRWRGVALQVPAAGRAAVRLGRALERAGARVEWARQGDQPRDLVVLCLDAPDLGTLDAWNRRALRSGTPFVSAFPLGDELLFGPLATAGGPCARCLLLRLAGIAPHVPVERALLGELAAERGRGETVDLSTAGALAAGLIRYLAEHPADEPRRGSVELADRTTGEVSGHRLLAHPACDVCGPGDRRGSRTAALGWARRRGEEAPSPALGEAGERLRAVTDDRVGLVTAPAPVAAAEDAGDLHVATARFAVFHPELVVSHQRNVACGMAASAEDAAVVARVEALERYCLGATVAPAATGSFEALAGDAVDPADLALHSERQAERPGFPFARFDRRRPLTWIWAYDLVEDRPRLLPEETASAHLARPRLFATTSSGVAAQWSREAALVAAALELVERDAFLLHWLLRLSPPRLADAETEAAFPAACRELRAGGYRMVLADLRLDLPLPVVAAFGLGSDDGKPALLLGAAAGLDPAAAAAKAVRELRGAVRSWRGRRLAPGGPIAAEAVRRLEDHAAAYAHPAWRERAAFLWSGPEVASFAPLPGTDPGARPLARLLAALRRRRLTLLAIDLTTPDVAATDLRVVRAVVPGLQPLGFGPFADRLGSRRPYEIAARFGLSPAEADLNTDPHCFP